MTEKELKKDIESYEEEDQDLQEESDSFFIEQAHDSLQEIGLTEDEIEREIEDFLIN